MPQAKKKVAPKKAPTKKQSETTESQDPQDAAIASAVAGPQRVDPYEAEMQKQYDLEQARKVHNARTGGGSINEAEVVKQNLRHLERTAVKS